jgi:thioredoxin 1
MPGLSHETVGHICRGMAFETTYTRNEPSGAAVRAMCGPVLIEFGTHSCGWCSAAQPHIAEALATHPSVRHLKIEDGSGRPLGRAFGVKLWPTLIFLRDGRESSRLVRPRDTAAIEFALDALVHGQDSGDPGCEALP